MNDFQQKLGEAGVVFSSRRASFEEFFHFVFGSVTVGAWLVLLFAAVELAALADGSVAALKHTRLLVVFGLVMAFLMIIQLFFVIYNHFDPKNPLWKEATVFEAIKTYFSGPYVACQTMVIVASALLYVRSPLFIPAFAVALLLGIFALWLVLPAVAAAASGGGAGLSEGDMS